MINIENLPTELEPREVLEIAYEPELDWTVERLKSGHSVLIECDKQVVVWSIIALRKKLRDESIDVIVIEGRENPNAGPLGGPSSPLKNMMAEINAAVKTAKEDTVIVVPHLDFLTSNSQDGTLTSEARDLMPLLYENPNIVFLGFKDPAFVLSKVIENLFPAKAEMVGIQRDSLEMIITQSVYRKFPKDYPIIKLYQYLSGVNPIRIHEILGSLTDMIDYPEDDCKVIDHIRKLTLGSDMEMPNVDLKKDIGGYDKVKDKIESEILNMLEYRQTITDEEELKSLDSIIPKGMIFWGPPGTGKTFFAKAMATTLKASIQIVSGPELKSMWVGKSEENIRKVFAKARQSAPAIIVFDELDSFAGSRNNVSSNGVSHSMVNQLLTEMDGFRKDELVFVIGTTNFVSSLDSALLRPGRFEMKIQIPYPEDDDRREIVKIYNEKMKLNLGDKNIDYLVEKTGEIIDPMTGTPMSGDHINSVMRFLKRTMIREKLSEFTIDHLNTALRGGNEKKKVKDSEKEVIAYHEAGHALASMLLKEGREIERISVDSDLGAALGYVRYQDDESNLINKDQFEAMLISLMAGRVSEEIILNKLSGGSSNDIQRANQIANVMVSKLGMSEAFGTFVIGDHFGGHQEVSEGTLQLKDEAIRFILKKAEEACKEMLEKNKGTLEKLGSLLLENRVLEKNEVKSFIEENKISKEW